MSNQNVRPILVNAAMASKALGDTNFFSQVPEFLPMKQKVTQMRIELNNGRGCSSCKKRRVQKTLFSDFLSILRSLSPDGMGRLKRYLGAQALMLQWRDAKTRQHKVEVL